MLKVLRIFNIILIDEAEICFEDGLNAITGETGSGKSAIMQALGLIGGARSDATVIRKGCSKGTVEAIFEIDHLEELKDVLMDAGIDLDDSCDLIVRREILENGKSRGYINNQLVQITFLKRVGELLLDIVGQHASRHLLSLDSHRDLIDTYGNLKEGIFSFCSSWSKENSLRKEHNELVNGEAKRLREISRCTMELEELYEARLKEGEEEELFLEYSRHTNSEELAERSNAIIQALKGEKFSAIQLLNNQRDNFEKLISLDTSLAESLKAFRTTIVELQEVAYNLSSFCSKIEFNPERSAFLNARLSTINNLKRKYGSSIADIQNYQQETEQRLNKLENIDANISEMEMRIHSLEMANNKMALEITSKRKKVIAAFEKAIVLELRDLNMPSVEFKAEITGQKRSGKGDDLIEFFLLPNVGEHRVPLKDSASGGEISRVALAFHSVLAGKEKRALLVFDEIDANIGGATGAVVGKKLKEIAAKQQVICITHFPQVAKQAKVHWQISKIEKNGRTSTQIELLDVKTRKKELARMIGEDV